MDTRLASAGMPYESEGCEEGIVSRVCRSRNAGGKGGGCAFRGAKLALQPIADVAHLVHGPITCQGHSWDSRPTDSSGPLVHRRTFTTDLGEMDLIHGGEAKLARAVDEIAARHAPEAIFVYQTCLPGMAGDDIVAVCKDRSARLGLPVVPVDAPGFAGGMVFGNAFASQVLLDHVIGRREPDERTPADINIIGEYNVAGELGQMTPLLREMGVRVLSSIPGDGRFWSVAGSHRARAALSLCSRALVGLAEGMREHHGVPFVEGSFYGISSTSRTLLALAHLLAERGGPPDMPGHTQALVAREEAWAWAALAPLRKRLKGKRAVLVAGGVKSWSQASALAEIGIEVVGTSLHKSTPDDRRKALLAVGQPSRLHESLTGANLLEVLRAERADVVLSGYGAQFVAARAGAAWVDIKHHRSRALTGYQGMVRLAQDIDRALASPVLSQARSPAPWARGTRAVPALRDEGTACLGDAGAGLAEAVACVR